MLRRRIDLLLALPLDKLDRLATPARAARDRRPGTRHEH